MCNSADGREKGRTCVRWEGPELTRAAPHDPASTRARTRAGHGLVAGSAHTQARALVHFVYTHRIGHWKPVSTALLTIDVVPPRVHGQGAAHTSAAEKLLATCVRAGWGPSGIVVGRRPDIMSLRGRFLGHEHPGIKVLQDNQDA